jgi:hypothetical protein
VWLALSLMVRSGLWHYAMSEKMTGSNEDYRDQGSEARPGYI